MRPVELFFVFLVEYCFIDGLSGLNWKQYDGFNPEEHENYKLLPPKNSCGTNGLGTQTRDEKVVGGYVTKLGEIPWIVEYGLNEVNGTFTHYCGGNLISERYVLIAGHCIEKKCAECYVRLGEWDTRGDPDSQGDLHAPPVEGIAIAESILHENYDTFETNDIGLIRLKTPAQLNYFVQPVCLPYGEAMSKDFTNADTIIAGWGCTVMFGSMSPILLALKQTVTKCREGNGRLNDGQICAGGKEEGKGSCIGDSGGPLLWIGSFEPNIQSRTYLLGITSYGVVPVNTMKGLFPDVYTRTSFFMKWILDNMRA